MTPLTDAQLDELARLEAGASEGDGLRYVAAAMDALPALLAELRLLRTLAHAMEPRTPTAGNPIATAWQAYQQWKRGAK